MTAELLISILPYERPLDDFLRFISIPLSSTDLALKQFPILNPSIKDESFGGMSHYRTAKLCAHG
jgi:hypothetical protein